MQSDHCGVSLYLGRRAAIAPLLAVLVAFPGFAQAVKRVPKWSLYEIALTADQVSGNPYIDQSAQVLATFNGPGGRVVKVPGFWDGARSFKIRFAPTMEGTWTYSTVSKQSGLNGITGQLQCVPASGSQHGFLRIDASHPHAFVWDDGTRYFMWGQTYYDVLQPALVNNNWKISVDRSLAYGMNKIRMHVYAQNYYKPGVEFNKYPDAQPYLGASTNPDRDRLNIPYWKKLDEMVEYLAAKGMVADLIVTNPYWDNRQFGTSEQNDRFVRYVVARYGAYSHVIWCLANEWDLSSEGNHYKGPHRQTKRDFDRMGAVLRTNDPWMVEGSLLRPLSIHNTTKNFEFISSTWPTYLIIQYGGWNPDYDNGDEWGNAGIVYNLKHRMPVVNDEYGYIGQRSPKPSVRVEITRTRLRGANWGIAVAGGYGSIGDFRVTPDGMGNVEITGDWFDAPDEYGDLKRMVDFFKAKVPYYWKMSSQNQLVTAGKRVYVLADPGRQYIAYAAVGGKLTLKLAPGKYRAVRYDPLDGREVPLGNIDAGEPVQLTLPEDHDYVVNLVKTP